MASFQGFVQGLVYAVKVLSCEVSLTETVSRVGRSAW